MRETLQQKIPGADAVNQRLKTEIAALDAQIASLGHTFCETRLRALGSQVGTWGERLNGFGRKSVLNSLLPQDATQLSTALSQLQQRLLGTERAYLAVSGVTPSLAYQFIAELSRTEDHGKRPQPFDLAFDLALGLAMKEGIPTNAPNFTTGQALRIGEAGPAHVAAHMLETGWLWDSVRVAGGAYSVRCRHDAGDGLLTMLSIRDPRPLSTLDRFREASLWLQHNARDDLLERCIAAKTGQLICPVRPDDVVTVALQRHLCGETDDLRQSALEDVRLVSAASINQFSQKFEAELPKARTVILGPRDGLHSALSKRFGIFEMQPELG
jgi:Zn-dependent M16 (insulinase) family peptidase